jgi:hypothetical protein
VTLSKKGKMLVISASVGLAFFFLAPVVPVQGQTSVPVPADSIVARHCGWKSYNYTWQEFKSFGSQLFGFGYQFVKYNQSLICQ